MGSLERPKLRPLPASRFEWEGRLFVRFEDPAGVVSHPVLVPLDAYQQVVRHFDGRSTLPQVLARVREETGQDVELDELARLVDELDQALVLDGPRFDDFHRDFQRDPVRSPAFAGRSYPASDRQLRSQLRSYFLHPEGAGLPSRASRRYRTKGRLRAVACPHIDYQRGGTMYTWAHRALYECSDAEVFVVLGVAHQPCQHRFVLTRKDFATPLGTVRTDREYVDRIARHAGAHHFEDELAHRTEHSIEFQAILLQYLWGTHGDVRIVPILVGSFHDLMRRGTDPAEDPEVGRFVAALREAEEASGRRVAYLGSIDLSHIGPEFGDPRAVDGPTLEELERHDRSMLDRAIAGDPEGWFRTAARVGNRTRICGLAAAYTMLRAIGPVQGRHLRYGRSVDESGQCCVSFASAVFEAECE